MKTPKPSKKEENMQNFTITTAIHFGQNALSVLSDIGYDKVFIISDPFAVTSGLIKHVTKYLDIGNIKYTVYTDVVPDPPVEKVTAGVTALLREKAPCIIAVGGGSAIDLTKCVRLFANHMEKDYFPRFIAIPTTSGTGSEVTSFAVITDTSTNVKHALTDQKLLPEDAILDVEMVKTVPASITADTGMDVMTHAIEAYVSTNCTVFSDMYAKKATKNCKDFLVRSYNFLSTGDTEAREQMHVASTMAGVAFNAASLGLNHGMAHQLGAQFHIPHGRANAILLPAIIGYNTGINSSTFSFVTPTPTIKKYAKLARRMDLGAYNDIASVKALMSYIDEMRIQMAMPRSVKDAVPKLSREEYMSKLDSMADAALADKCTATNPRIPTKSDIIELYEHIFDAQEYTI